MLIKHCTYIHHIHNTKNLVSNDEIHTTGTLQLSTKKMNEAETISNRKKYMFKTTYSSYSSRNIDTSPVSCTSDIYEGQ